MKYIILEEWCHPHPPTRIALLTCHICRVLSSSPALHYWHVIFVECVVILTCIALLTYYLWNVSSSLELHYWHVICGVCHPHCITDMSYLQCVVILTRIALLTCHLWSVILTRIALLTCYLWSVILTRIALLTCHLWSLIILALHYRHGMLE